MAVRLVTGASRPGSTARLIAIISVLAAGLFAVCITLVLEARRAALAHAIDTARSVVAAIEADIYRTIDSYDLSLRAVVDDLRNPAVNNISPELRQLVLFDRSASASHLSSISVLDANGIVRLDSRTPHPEPISRAERDYFQFHKHNASNDLHINRPFIARSDSARLVNLSRRINGADGDFVGVVAGSIRLSYFSDLFKKAALGYDGNITLSSMDGIVLTRWPYDERFVGLDIKNADIYKHLAHERSGYFETYSKTDGVRRLVVYSQIAELPLVVGVGQSTAEIYSAANWYSAIAIVVVGALLALSAMLAWQLVRELKQRAAMQENLDRAMSQMSQGLSMFDENLKLVICNDKFLEMYSLQRDQVKPGCSFDQVLQLCKDAGTFSGEIAPFVSGFVQRLSHCETVSNVTVKGDGKTLLAVNCPRTGGGWVATHDDITERQRAETELATVKTFLDSVIENIPVPVAVKNPSSKKFVLVNKAYESFLGMPREQIIGSTVFDQFRHDVATEITSFDTEALEKQYRIVSGEFSLETRAKGRRVVKTTRIVVRDQKNIPQYLIVVIDDVTDRKNSEAKIAHLAHYDSLTGLANRSLFRERIDVCLARTKRYRSEFAVFLLDLDRFKAVNDSLGHEAGDALLREVAGRVNGAIRDVDFAARLGGDEFALIVAPGGGSLREGFVTLATRLLTIIAAPYELFGTTISIGTSIGIAVAPHDASSADDLMKFADLAMYQAKREGRNDFRFFSPKMDQEAQARRNLEGELRSAFADEEFELLYQPIVESASGVAISAEALVRWRHPKRGLLKPDEFIPCAEDSGLIAPLGEWVLRRACAEATTWPAEIKVAVNVSAAQCQKGNLVDIVVLALAESGLAPDRLELEFTESVLLNRTDSNLATFHQLRKLGVGIVMDDFGAGFSSLRYLQQFPFHKLKIDRSFVSSLVHDKSSVAIVCAVNTLAKGLNIVTVAEGIETPEQYDLLRLAGCDQMQGFLFSQPAQPSQLKFGQSLRPATTSNAA